MKRPKIYTVPYTMLLTTKQHDHLKTTYGDGRMAANVRATIDADMVHSAGKLPQLRKQLEILEPQCIAIKKQIIEEEIKEKEENEKISIREMRIQDAHKKLLNSLKCAYWDPEGIQKSVYRLYADYTGLSVKELMDWVQDAAQQRDQLENGNISFQDIGKKIDKVQEPEKIIEEPKEPPEKIIDEKTKKDRISDAHEKLLDSLKRAYWDPEGIQKAAYLIYADYTGLSVKELMDWVQEQAKRKDEID